MNNLEVFRSIKTFIFDVDGVLTNNDVIILENGRLIRKMNIRDGFAIKTAIRKGYRVAIITGGKSSGVKENFKNLGIKDLYTGVESKVEAFEDLVLTYDLDPGSILYMGDDIPDYEVMSLAGLACCPADAAIEIRRIATYASNLKGGEGCARDVIEKVLTLNGDWPFRKIEGFEDVT
ncbi:MAG: 3-deoxy-D-manno-octulosonate 8-phosphate phosphatase [Bacteroidota bacterium]